MEPLVVVEVLVEESVPYQLVDGSDWEAVGPGPGEEGQ